MAQYYPYSLLTKVGTNVPLDEMSFYKILEANDWKCNAAARLRIAERVQVTTSRPKMRPEDFMKLARQAEELGGLKPGEKFEYRNAQGGYSVARVVDLYNLPTDMVNPYLYCFSGIMHAPLYAIEALRFYYKQTGILLPFISSGKEGNKGLFIDLFSRKKGLIRGTEYDSYYRLMSQLIGHEWAYKNYTPCSDTDTEGNLMELYHFAKTEGLKEVTFVMVSGNPFYDKRLLAEWMWQLRQPKYHEVKINLVLAHCPVWYAPNLHAAIPEAPAGSEIALGYIAACLGPLTKDTITFDGKTESPNPERCLMPGVAKANWEIFREVICYHSNMGWPNYQELLYGIPHEEAVANVILADLFARASFNPHMYDVGMKKMLANYTAFLGGSFYEKGLSLEDYLLQTTEKHYFE